MRRSLLFIPANSPAMLQNADVFSADAVIFDLEDAVDLNEKDAALLLLDQFLNTFELKGIEKIVRINQVDSPYFTRDLKYIVNDRIDTIMLPKANLENTTQLAKTLTQIEKQTCMSVPIRIIPIIETAQSVIEMNEIAKIARVNGLLLGGEDLATDLEVERTENGQEIFLSRSLLILAAKAQKIDAIDTPYTHTKNEKGLIKDALQAKSLGMNAKACIHPNQIDTVNQLFSPSQEEIEYAQKIMNAYKKAKENHKGAFSIDGKMIDKPIIERADKILEKAKIWNLL
ncbi:MAG: CoA ester lyase [Acholeplasmataceae bacterium]|nr:CoA ester lyase [Acholeplasmataceae bacterium]